VLEAELDTDVEAEVVCELEAVLVTVDVFE